MNEAVEKPRNHRDFAESHFGSTDFVESCWSNKVESIEERTETFSYGQGLGIFFGKENLERAIAKGEAKWVKIKGQDGKEYEKQLREAKEFKMAFVTLFPDGTLAFYQDEALQGAPLGARALPAGEAASPLTPALYNYEHAFVVGGDAADRWWLCPDTPEESKEWLAALNNRRRS